MTRAGRLPSFLIIGAAKSGTTTLFSDLDAHPDIFFPVVKEPGDLAKDAILAPGGVETYSKLFADAGPNQVLGEASTIYTARPMFDGSALRARRVLGPDLKIIYLVRDPFDRLLSEHRYSAMLGKMSGNINEALRTDAWLIEQSRYAYQLGPWIEQFGSDRLRLVVFERYVKSRESTVTSLFTFLGAPQRADYQLPEMKNKSSDVIIPRGALRRLSRTDFYRRTIRRWVPASIRDKAKPLLGRSLDVQLDQALTSENELMLIDRLRPEVEQFHQMVGWTTPTWNRFA
jgi:hypothetical protein